MSYCNQFIFCFNHGNLIRRILLESESGMEPDTVKERLVSFYSFQMFLIHYQSLGNQADLKAKLRETFLETHRHESLKSYLKCQNQSVNESMLKTGIRPGASSRGLIEAVKSIVLTRSRSSPKQKSSIELLVSDVEDQGSLHLKKEFMQALIDPECHNIIIRFDKPDTLRHFNFLQSQIDNWLAEKRSEMEEPDHTNIYLIVQKSETAEKQEAEYIASDWQYLVIENLTNTSYFENVNLVDMNTFEITQKLQKEIDLYSTAQIFFEAFKQIGFTSYLGQLVRDKCIQSLVSVKSGAEKPRTFFIKFLLDFFNKLDENSHFKNLPDWKQQLFKKNEDSGKSLASIQTIVKRVFASLLQKHLKNLCVELHKEHVLLTLFSFENFKNAARKKVRKFFIEKLREVIAKVK